MVVRTRQPMRRCPPREHDWTVVDLRKPQTGALPTRPDEKILWCEKCWTLKVRRGSDESDDAEEGPA